MPSPRTPSLLYSDFSVPKIILSLEGDIELPPHMNYGVTGKVKKLLFELLPPMSAQNGVTSFTGSVVSEVQEAMEREKAKANTQRSSICAMQIRKVLHSRTAAIASSIFSAGQTE